MTARIAPPPFKVGETVFHRSFGSGEVIAVRGETVVVRFGEGVRKIIASHLFRDVTHTHARAWAEAAEGAASDPDPAHFDPPALPDGLLPPVLEEYATVQGEMMGADPGGLAAAALAVCAAAIPDRIRLQVKVHDHSWTESARIWIALIGDPSTKKSPIMSQAVKPIARIDGCLYRDWCKAMSEYEALPKEEQKFGKRPKQIRIRLEDTTIEAAQEVLKDSPEGVLCYQDELSGWFGSMDKYSGARGAGKDRAFWLQSFNGGSYIVNRVGRGSVWIDNLSVSMLGGIQPELIRKLSAETLDDGLLQRLFPVVLRPATLGRDEPRAHVVAGYEDLVEQLNQLAPPTLGGNGNLADVEALALRFEEGAQEIRRELERQHLDLISVDAVNKKLAAHIGKLDGLFARLCVVWHCVENADQERLPPIVTAATAERVAGFLHRFLLPHAIAFYAGVLGISEGHDALTATAGYILAHDHISEITLRAVQRGDRTMRSLTRDEAQRILERLEYFGWLQPVAMARNGTAPRWQVNRRVRELFAEKGRQEAKRRNQARETIRQMATGSEA